MTRVTITSNADKVAAKILSLKKQIRKEVEKSTRDSIKKRIVALQKDLDFLVNQYQKVEGTNKGLTSQPLAQKIAEEQALGKSRAVNYGDDFHTTFESPTYKAALVNGGNNYAMRVRDSNIHPDATYQDYRDSFTSTLTSKVFAIQSEIGGGYRYYIIEPGSPLLDEVLEGVKIFCSSFTDLAGSDRDEGDKWADIGVREGEKKFGRDKEKGHTEFTLKENAIRAIKERGSDVTDLVLNTQHGEYLDASTIAAQYKNSAMQDAFKRATEAYEGKNISKEAKAVANTNKAINNITIKESISENLIKYAIQTTIDDKLFVSDEVVHAAKREALIWTKNAASGIAEALSEAISKVLDIFNRGK